MGWRHLAWLVLPIAAAAPVAAALADGPGVPPAYVNAARAHDVPPVMLYALSLTESATQLSYGRRPWPWTLNIAGAPHRYTTRRAACQALRVGLQHTHVIDVGIAQLNVHWQRKLFGAGERFADPCDALNPYANLDAAAALLRACFEDRGDWVDAAGCYHRPAGGAPAARYRHAYRAQLASIGARVTAPSRGGHSVATRQTPTPSDVAVSAGHSVASAKTPTGDGARVTWINPTPEADRNALD